MINAGEDVEKRELSYLVTYSVFFFKKNKPDQKNKH